jgi:hypothetical protein
MKFSIVALTALLGVAAADKAVVMNSCSSTVYVQSYPYDGSKAGPLTAVKPGKSFSENLRASGSVRVPCDTFHSEDHVTSSSASMTLKQG